jgi:hypothetical protein
MELDAGVYAGLVTLRLPTGDELAEFHRTATTDGVH